MHPLFLLVAATLVLVIAFLGWNYLSVQRHRFGRDRTGIGGSSDPLAGKTKGLRSPDEMRAAMDTAIGYRVDPGA